MKWNEMSTVQKFLFLLGCVCGVTCLVLIILEAIGVLTVSMAWVRLIMCAFWLCSAFTQKDKRLAIAEFILAAGWFFASVFSFGK